MKWISLILGWALIISIWLGLEAGDAEPERALGAIIFIGFFFVLDRLDRLERNLQ